MSFQNFRQGTLYISSKMVGPEYIDFNARAILSLSEKKLDFVFGGARTGMMGLVSDLALAAGRKVSGVIPHKLAEAGMEHPKLTDLIFVDDMASRRREMTSRGDFIINFSGGVGTADEGVEAALWLHQGLHNKPVFFAAPNGFWDGVKSFFESLHENGLIDELTHSRLIFCDTPEMIASHLTKLDTEPAFNCLDEKTYQYDEDVLKDPHSPAFFDFSLKSDTSHPLEEFARLINVMIHNQILPDSIFMRPIAVLDPDGLFENTVEKWLNHMIEQGFALDHDKGTYTSAPTERELESKLAILVDRIEKIKSSGSYTAETLKSKWNNHNLDGIISQYKWHYLRIKDKYFHPSFEDSSQRSIPLWDVPKLTRDHDLGL